MIPRRNFNSFTVVSEQRKIGMVGSFMDSQKHKRASAWIRRFNGYPVLRVATSVIDEGPLCGKNEKISTASEAC